MYLASELLLWKNVKLSTPAQNVNNMIKITLKFIIYMSNQVDCHYFELILIKLTFWPDDLEDDLAWPCIIYIWNLYEQSSWMIPCTAQYDKFEFWPFLTFTDLGWLCMLVNHIFLKTTWKIELITTIPNSFWYIWILTFLDLYRPWMTLYHGKVCNQFHHGNS